MVVGRNNGVVGLTGFSDKKMSGLLFGPQKSGRNNGVVVWRGSTVCWSACYVFECRRVKMFSYFFSMFLLKSKGTSLYSMEKRADLMTTKRFGIFRLIENGSRSTFLPRELIPSYSRLESEIS